MAAWASPKGNPIKLRIKTLMHPSGNYLDIRVCAVVLRVLWTSRAKPSGAVLVLRVMWVLRASYAKPRARFADKPASKGRVDHYSNNAPFGYEFNSFSIFLKMHGLHFQPRSFLLNPLSNFLVWNTIIRILNICLS